MCELSPRLALSPCPAAPSPRPPLLEQPPGTGRGGTRRGRVGGLPGGLNPHLQEPAQISPSGALGHGADEPVRGVEEGTFAVGHSRVPGRPLGEGGMTTDQSMLAPGPWGVHPLPGPSIQSVFCPGPLGSLVLMGLLGGGAGADGPLGSPPLPRPPLASSPWSSALPTQPPRPPRGPANLQACSPLPRRAAVRGMCRRLHVSQPGRSLLAAQGTGVGGREEAAGLRGAEQRTHREGRGWLLPGLRLFSQAGRFGPQEPPWVPSGTPTAEPAAARDA